MTENETKKEALYYISLSLNQRLFPLVLLSWDFLALHPFNAFSLVVEESKSAFLHAECKLEISGCS